MHEVVIVVSDLYLSQETPEGELPHGVTLPGLQHIARFGTRARVVDGWRPWLARWLTGRDGGAPATVAAATTPGAPEAEARAPMVWMATPVHLVAGLTSLHLDRGSILRLDPADLVALAADFQRVFEGSEFQLQPLDSGDFLLFGPQISLAETLEPARSMGNSVADTQRAGSSDPALRRLGAEIEMWLHAHPINDARRRHGAFPITGLWLWGGGPVPADGPAPVPAPPLAPAPALAPAQALAPALAPIYAAVSSPPTSPACRGCSDIAFGCDAYLAGLWHSTGKRVLPVPQQLAGVFGYPHARRAVLVIEIGPLLHSNPMWTFFNALAQIDHAFIAPAVEALRQGKLERFVLIANDRQLTLRARDRFKLWRRKSPAGLSALQ